MNKNENMQNVDKSRKQKNSQAEQKIKNHSENRSGSDSVSEKNAQN